MSSTPCVNVTILDDNIPNNELYLTIGLFVASNDSNSVIIVPGKNQTTIAILDSDHGMVHVFIEHKLHQCNVYIVAMIYIFNHSNHSWIQKSIVSSD